MDFIKYDKRIIDRNLNKGELTPKEYHDYLKSLEDVSKEAEVIRIPLYPWEIESSDQKDGK